MISLREPSWKSSRRQLCIGRRWFAGGLKRSSSGCQTGEGQQSAMKRESPGFSYGEIQQAGTESEFWCLTASPPLKSYPCEDQPGVRFLQSALLGRPPNAGRTVAFCPVPVE
jgi:hypothetical protein